MAWLTTDWEKELEQVELKINEVLDDKVEPLGERLLTKTSAEMVKVISQAGFEIHETANHIFIELAVQRRELVKDMRSLIRYAGAVAFLVVIASALAFRFIGQM